MKGKRENMGRLRFLIALWVAKLSIVALKITGHNGTNFPGVIAIKICPQFLRYIGKPKRIIAITAVSYTHLETGSLKWTALAFFLPTVTGVSICFIMNMLWMLLS